MMKIHYKQALVAIPIFAFVAISMSFAPAYAHTMDVAGDYKVEIGWDEEPAIQGIENGAQVVVTYPASEEDKQAAAEMRAAMGMDSMDNQTSVGSMGNQMNMGTQSGAYDEKIIPILNQFDAKKISSAIAISQISEIVKMQTPTDDFDNEVKNLIDDVQSGKMTNDDAVYALIKMYGTALSNQMDNTMGNNMTMSDTHTTEEDHGAEGGVPGLENSLMITITLNGESQTYPLTTTDVDGIYHAIFTPAYAGFAVVHITGMIHDTKVDLTMHPEEIEKLSILPPLQQENHGIEPSNVQCKEGLQLLMRTYDNSAICVSDKLSQRLMSLGVVVYF